MSDNPLLQIRQGDDFSIQVVFNDSTGAPVDLTDYTHAFQVNLSGSAVYTTAPEVVVTDATHGKVTLSLTAAETALFWCIRGSYWYTVTSPGGKVTTLLEGLIDVDLQ